MHDSSNEPHDPFVVARLIGSPTATIVGVTKYGAPNGAPWRFLTVELDDGTSAITCTDLVQLVDVGQRTITP